MTSDAIVANLPSARLMSCGSVRTRRVPSPPPRLNTVHDTVWAGQTVQIGLQALPQGVQDPESFRAFLVFLRTGPSNYAGLQHAACLVTDRIGRPIPDEWMRFLVLFPGTQHEDAEARIFVPYARRLNALLTWECGETSFVLPEDFRSIEHVRLAVLMN